MKSRKSILWDILNLEPSIKRQQVPHSPKKQKGEDYQQVQIKKTKARPKLSGYCHLYYLQKIDWSVAVKHNLEPRSLLAKSITKFCHRIILKFFYQNAYE